MTMTGLRLPEPEHFDFVSEDEVRKLIAGTDRELSGLERAAAEAIGDADLAEAQEDGRDERDQQDVAGRRVLPEEEHEERQHRDDDAHDGFAPHDEVVRGEPAPTRHTGFVTEPVGDPTHPAPEPPREARGTGEEHRDHDDEPEARGGAHPRRLNDERVANAGRSGSDVSETPRRSGPLAPADPATRL